MTVICKEMYHNDEDKHIRHAANYNGNDITLCGLALEGEIGQWSDGKDKLGRINCIECKKIIRYCKSIDSKDMV